LNNWYQGQQGQQGLKGIHGHQGQGLDRQYGQVRQVVPQVQGKYGGVKPQLVNRGWGDHLDQVQRGQAQRHPQQWGELDGWQDNQNIGGQDTYQRMNRGRDF